MTPVVDLDIENDNRIVMNEQQIFLNSRHHSEHDRSSVLYTSNLNDAGDRVNMLRAHA